MHAISTSKSKVPMLPSQGITYAKFGTWRGHFSSTLTLKGLQVFAALDSAIPTECPVVHADAESAVSDDPAAAANTAAGDLAASASSYSARDVGASVTTWSLTDVSASSYSIRGALASATSWSFLERSGSASDSSGQSQPTSSGGETPKWLGG